RAWLARQRLTSGDDYGVAALEDHVLPEIPASRDVSVPEGQNALSAGIITTQDDDFIERGVGRRSACKAQRLHDVDGLAERKFSGPRALAYDINTVAADTLDRDGDDRIRDITLQALGQRLANFGDGLVLRLDVAREWKRDPAVGTHEDLAIEILFLP